MFEITSCNDYTEESKEVECLKMQLAEKDLEIERLRRALEKCDSESEKRNVGDFENLPRSHSDDLPYINKVIERYSRQILLLGLDGQQLLCKSSALIIGAGGLGCPAGLYLAACGIGKLGVVEYDKVEINNLHRQILHSEETVGFSKSQSFVSAIKRLNSLVDCVPYEVLLNSSNVADIIKPYTVIVDCSDNAPTRYLLNDACVFAKKPLVSGAALRFEGHLTVYNYDDGPCYRCLYPLPPSSGITTNCSEGGVIGAVTGVIGCLQALEVMKLCAGLPLSYNKKLLIFDGLTGEFRTVKLRGRNPKCAVCGDNPTIKQFIDYENFCQTSATDKTENVILLSDNERVSCCEYKKIMDENVPHVLLDVRPKKEVNICRLPCSVNIPFTELNSDQNLKRLKLLIAEKGTTQHYIICRRGNDSQRAVETLKESLKDMHVIWKDIKGGLVAWHNEVDSYFPVY